MIIFLKFSCPKEAWTTELHWTTFWLPQDLSHAEDEVNFYEEALQLQRQRGAAGRTFASHRIGHQRKLPWRSSLPAALPFSEKKKKHENHPIILQKIRRLVSVLLVIVRLGGPRTPGPLRASPKRSGPSNEPWELKQSDR